MTKKRKLTRRDALTFLPKLLANILIMLFSLSCIVPVLWLIISSLRTSKNFMADIMGFCSEFYYENYIKAIQNGHLNEYFGNSAYLTVLTVIISLIFSVVVGYFLARYEFHGKKFVYYLFLAGMIVPSLCLMIPVFLEFKALHLRDKWFTLLFRYLVF